MIRNQKYNHEEENIFIFPLHNPSQTVLWKSLEVECLNVTRFEEESLQYFQKRPF